MSLGGGISTALDNAVNAAFNSGVLSICAAGNSNSNACNGSPGRATRAYTVAASDSSDRKVITCIDFVDVFLDLGTPCSISRYWTYFSSLLQKYQHLPPVVGRWFMPNPDMYILLWTSVVFLDIHQYRCVATHFLSYLFLW